MDRDKLRSHGLSVCYFGYGSAANAKRTALARMPVERACPLRSEEILVRRLCLTVVSSLSHLHDFSVSLHLSKRLSAPTVLSVQCHRCRLRLCRLEKCHIYSPKQQRCEVRPEWTVERDRARAHADSMLSSVGAKRKSHP